MKNVLVTGGAGFIGSHLVDHLIANNINVTVIDNESTDVSEDYYWNNLASNHKLDVADYQSTRRLYDGIDVVFHLAAQNRIQKSFLNPSESLRVNTLGTANVLQCSLEAGVKRVVYSSTSSIYGHNQVPNVESQKPDCLNPYSISKFAGEQLCQMYYRQYGLETVILRYFNVYGDRQRENGEYSPVLATFMRQHRDGLPLPIVGDGEQRRSFTNVKDVVYANSLAAIADLPGDVIGTPFNVAVNENWSINEIASMFDSATFKIPERPGEVLVTLADNQKAKKYLGWKPEIKIDQWIKERL